VEENPHTTTRRYIVVTTALDITLLPAAAPELVYSADVPSPAGVRPFGLTHTTVVPDDALVALDHLRYDPVRQLNVDSDGRPATDPDQVIRMGTTTDTRYDNQWFEDKD
jgi:putative ATP-grasp target RiPP